MSHGKKRSSTGHHFLLPASSTRGEEVMTPFAPRRDVVAWTFGSGTVFWTIWPAVLLHTVFAAAVTSVSFMTPFYLAVPPVLITVLGVVIGFVISYRAMSGYERYWLGRGSWTDLIRISRTMSRLVWIHVPLKYDKDSPSDLTHAHKLMREKRLALDLIQAFSVAVKHHLRGETGIYYDDLYYLVKPLHDHPHFQKKPKSSHASARPETPNSAHSATSPSSAIRTPRSMPTLTADPHIPAINEYGTFRSISSCSSEDESERPYLKSTSHRTNGSRILTELVPFSSFFSTIGSWIGLRSKKAFDDDSGDEDHPEPKQILVPKYGRKFRPAIAGGGKNLPLEILSLLSEWVAILDERGAISGNPLGGLYGSLASFEDSLSTLEKILTTPLPFVYSAHIRQCVWLYLFLLPFQLVEQFEWFTIPGVCIAAFFYIGFLAAGEEIEQPFGYDENDLDLDLFCYGIIRADIESLKRTHCTNTHVPEHEVQVNGDFAHDRPSIEHFANIL